MDDLLRSRWRGRPGRLEVWYTTLTDPVTGTGVWLHHELVAPAGGGPAHAHGWIAVSEPDRLPVLERFGPAPWPAPASGFACGDVRYDGSLAGAAGDLQWHLEPSGPAGDPLFTFPAWAWHRELLPAAQVVSRPAVRYSGTIRLGDREISLRDAPGADARIFGHGNARRWGWLHADLGDGEVCEVVAAVSTRPGLRRLPPLALVKLRLRDGDLPGDPLAAAPLLRATLARDGWTVRGRVGRRALRIEVTLPAGRTVDVDYRDPDGADLLCRNSTRAVATIALSGPGDPRRWRLDGTAHAEVGGFREDVHRP
jgi:hypothetical protein